MGLHAQIHQVENEVSIALTGEIHAPEYDQLTEIVRHFLNRGCRHFVLDLQGVSRMNAVTEASLRQLVESPRSVPASRIPAPSAYVRITPQPGRRRAAGILLSEVEIKQF